MRIGPARTRTQRHRIVIFALCLFLFAQWSLAAHACPLYKLSVPQSDASMVMTDGSSCDHDAQKPEPVCQNHCDTDRQIPPAGALSFVLPPSTMPVLHVPVVTHETRPAPRHAERQATAPPLTILYCVSLT